MTSMQTARKNEPGSGPKMTTSTSRVKFKYASPGRFLSETVCSIDLNVLSLYATSVPLISASYLRIFEKTNPKNFYFVRLLSSRVVHADFKFPIYDGGIETFLLILCSFKHVFFSFLALSAQNSNLFSNGFVSLLSSSFIFFLKMKFKHYLNKIFIAH